MLTSDVRRVNDDLLSKRSAEYAVLTLNRPNQRNALSVTVRDAVSEALDDLGNDPSIKAVVVTGAGAVFSAGFDLKEFDRAGADPMFAENLWASSDRFHRAVLSFPLPLIAAVNGPAIAGGFDLAVMCDLRVASSTAASPILNVHLGMWSTVPSTTS